MYYPIVLNEEIQDLERIFKTQLNMLLLYIPPSVVSALSDELIVNTFPLYEKEERVTIWKLRFFLTCDSLANLGSELLL